MALTLLVLWNIGGLTDSLSSGGLTPTYSRDRPPVPTRSGASSGDLMLCPHVEGRGQPLDALEDLRAKAQAACGCRILGCL